MTKLERIELLENAEQLIAEAIANIEEALYGTDNENLANAYIIPHLNTWIGNGNPYDKSIDKYIDDLRTEDLDETF
jgi:hypothetical protein